MVGKSEAINCESPLTSIPRAKVACDLLQISLWTCPPSAPRQCFERCRRSAIVCNYLIYLGAGRGSRTPTVLPPADFESAASTNSAIPAPIADARLPYTAAPSDRRERALWRKHLPRSTDGADPNRSRIRWPIVPSSMGRSILAFGWWRRRLRCLVPVDDRTAPAATMGRVQPHAAIFLDRHVAKRPVVGGGPLTRFSVFLLQLRREALGVVALRLLPRIRVSAGNRVDEPAPRSPPQYKADLNQQTLI